MHSLCSRTKQYISNVSRKSTNSSHKLALASIVTASAFAISLFSSAPSAYAATTPDSCFAFNGNGTITRYYNNEGNNSSNPACPRDVEIPSQIGGVAVTGIGSNTFSYKNITSVDIPNSVMYIDSEAFFGNINLLYVVIPDSVTHIGMAAFYESGLTQVSLPSGITEIDMDAFGNNKLTSVDIPDSVVSIGGGAFAYNQLTSFTIPASVTSIGRQAFAYNRLTSITLNEGLRDVGKDAFVGNALTQVYVPSTVESISSDSGGFLTGTSVFGVQGDPELIYEFYHEVEMDGAGNIMPDSYSVDFVKTIITKTWYLKVYLADSTNPRGFVDNVNVGRIGIDDDDSGYYIAGGDIIMPASATYKYVDANGNSLQDDTVTTGVTADGEALNDYITANGPIPAYSSTPSGIDERPSVAQTTAFATALSS